MITTPPLEKLDAQSIARARPGFFQFLSSLRRSGSGWDAGQAMRKAFFIALFATALAGCRSASEPRYCTLFLLPDYMLPNAGSTTAGAQETNLMNSPMHKFIHKTP